MPSLSSVNAGTEFRLLARRTKILKAVANLVTEQKKDVNNDEILIRCAETLLLHSGYSAIFILKYKHEENKNTPLALVVSELGTDGRKRVVRCETIDRELSQYFDNIPKPRNHLICRNILPVNLQTQPACPQVRSYGVWRLSHKGRLYGDYVICSEISDGFPKPEKAFVENSITNLSQAIYTYDIRVQLQLERDFNTEIIDTVQALLVSITPCGKIRRFNPEAEKVTGYSQKEVMDRYWVDVLLAPENRLEYQKLVSGLLKNNHESNRKNISFNASLQTKSGENRTIEWHGSIKPEIDKGTVGMVLFGLDMTDMLATNQAYSSAVAKWENIFTTIQDPALIVTRSGKIIDANHATFSAARRTREEVIGRSASHILYGDLTDRNHCQLEDLLRSGKSRILHTELGGLHGDYLLTISPLKRAENEEGAALIVARDTTEEEQLRAEALRAGQLASIGELAAGVAHEINNPINGILNYAQMLLELVSDRNALKISKQILNESRRIEGIVRSLLNFSRYREEDPEPVCIMTLIKECLQLVEHQFRQEGISVSTEYSRQLPLAFCNVSQIKQVVLNILSNSRYALNRKYARPDTAKAISIRGNTCRRGNSPFVKVRIEDSGTGIEPHHVERVFDPFFSTKPTGEGTGLGLSISYGLVRDNGGHIRISSEFGAFTSATIELPIVEETE